MKLKSTFILAASLGVACVAQAAGSIDDVSLDMATTAVAAADAELLWSLNVPGSTADTLLFNYTDDYTGSKNLAKTSTNSNYGIAADGALTTDGSTSQIIRFEGDSGLHMYDSFSYVVKASVNSEATWAVLFGLGEAGDWNIKVSMTDSTPRHLGFYKEGYTALDSASVADKTLTMNEVHTFVLTADNPIGTHQGADSALCLYVDGELFATGTLHSNNATHEPLDVFTIGGRPLDTSNRTAMTVYEVSMYKGVVDPKNLVPEPATATLSLLALAGLASRRRRK